MAGENDITSTKIGQAAPDHISQVDTRPLDDDGNEGEHPTEEEKTTLRKVAGKIPMVAYTLCAVELAERASYYGVQPLFNNFINKGFPVGGNGWGATAKGTQDTPGALGMHGQVASAVTSAFSMLVYATPVLWGWLADAKTGRWTLICWGVAVCGISHVLMVGAGAPALLQAGKAAAPFFFSVFLLAVGAAMFKPNISPVLLDQMPVTTQVTKTLPSGEKVIVDPEATTERVMLWFYLLINIGGFMNVATSWTEKLVGWWVAFFIPLVLYLPLPFLLFWLRKRLILHPPGGSELGKVSRICGFCLRKGGIRKIWSGKFFEAAKPSNIARSGSNEVVDWTDEYVQDVQRTFEATAIFSFFPIQFINDNGLGAAAGVMSTMLRTDGVPNDVIGNFNSLIIILANPILNYLFYPWLRKRRIEYGPVARMTTGFFISTLGAAGYAILCYYAYKKSPCGSYGSTECKDAAGHDLVADISIWWMAIPYALGGLSELFVNVPAYGIAYSRAPPNMRGLVSALNLFSTAIAYAIGLACAGVVKDPYLVWVFTIPAIIGAVATPVFYFLFRHIDNEEYRLTSAEEDAGQEPGFKQLAQRHEEEQTQQHPKSQ